MYNVLRPAIFIILLLLLSFNTFSQHGDQQHYYWPEDTLVLKKLSWWQDQKFGLLMHWGPYSQWGVVESWSICPEDEDWCTRRGPYSADYFNYRRAYEGLAESFNPARFNPEKWAEAAANAGMKYMVFTTKHHDGFSMFDTKLTDYRITGPDCPFSANPRANVTLEIFNAFREKDMGIGAYFSKPDWHCPEYWDPYFPPTDRNPNYSLKRYPEKWQRYKDFTYGQIRELLTDYGDVDILWLDGGWVKKCEDKSMPGGSRIVNQDIDMPAMAAMARSLQPGILVVDRAVEGPDQNYLTPEQRIPEKPLAFPWETCMTMATSWSYVPNDTYKSSTELIHLLCKIVSRGGNLLLNIGPGPDGEWADEAYQRLEDIGNWMKVNSEAIYNSRPVAPYEKQGSVYTSVGDKLYVIYLNTPGDTLRDLQLNIPEGYAAVPELLGSSAELKYNVRSKGKAIDVTLSEKDALLYKTSPAFVFRFLKE